MLEDDDASAATADAADDVDGAGAGTNAAARIASGTEIVLGGPQSATRSSVTLVPVAMVVVSRAQLGLRVMIDVALEDWSVRRDTR